MSHWRKQTRNVLENHTDAILYYDKVLAIDPKNIRALTDKGLALDALGNRLQKWFYSPC
jgi:Flp pilus assembly protein TadD